MSWAFQEEAVQANKLLRKFYASTAKAGISTNAGRVLYEFMATLLQEADELTVSIPLWDLARTTGLSQHQVKRAIAELHEAGMLSSRQDQKSKGCEAIRTVMPKAFAAIGLKPPGEGLAKAATAVFPPHLTKALCGMPCSVVDQVCDAWMEGRRADDLDLSEARGGAEWLKLISQLLQARALELEHAASEAAEQVMQAEMARKAGHAIVETADGTVYVDIGAFEKSCPVETRWEFVEATLKEIGFRNPGLVTKGNVGKLMAEAAYARAYSPFCRGLAFQQGVWALGGLMSREDVWKKPRKIWPAWYTAASQACGAVLHH